MRSEQILPATQAVQHFIKNQEIWRSNTRRILNDTEGLFVDWKVCDLALSRVPRIDRPDIRLAHPQSTYMSGGWRRALRARHRIQHDVHAAQNYAKIYDRLSVQKPDLCSRAPSKGYSDDKK